MAIYHLSATIVQRSSGRSAVAAAAYRSGTKLEDRQYGKTHDYTPRKGIERSFILAPEDAPDWVHDREELWNRAELAERRKDAQVAREVRVALPHELDRKQHAELVKHFVEDAFVKRGMVADVAIHYPDRHGDERNHHAHILLTMRELDSDDFASRKQRDWNAEQTLQEWRELWARYQNEALEDAGSAERVDNRSYEDMGINRMPTAHLGYEASAMERRGLPTRIGDENREAAAYNRNFDQLVGDLAELDAEIAAEREQEFLVEKQAPAPQAMTREEWEAYKRQMQSIDNDPATREHARLIKERGPFSLLEDNSALYDVDSPTRDRVTQDNPQLNIEKDEPDLER
jgi:ATP-dependent exoDNAse (exonuclease V) alpha subunit